MKAFLTRIESPFRFDFAKTKKKFFRKNATFR